MVRPTAERLLSRLWRCCSIGLIASAALAQLVLLDPGEPATAALLPAEAMEECLRAALASPLALLPRAPPRSLDAALLDAALQAARDEAAPDDTTVVLTFVDSHMLDWLLNWLVHVRAARIPHVVGAMDAPTLNVLAHCGVHAFSGGGGDMGSDWGAKNVSDDGTRYSYRNVPNPDYATWTKAPALPGGAQTLTIKATVISCPVTLIGQWHDEITKWAPGLRVLAPESDDACFGYPHSVVPINRTHVLLIDDGEPVAAVFSAEVAAACEPPLTTPMDGSVLALVDPHALL